MILNLIQTQKKLFTADFVIMDGRENECGDAQAKGKLSNPYADMTGVFDQRSFELIRDFNKMAQFKHIGNDQAFHPYKIVIDGMPEGFIYQYGVKQVSGIYDRSYIYMELDGEVSDTWSVFPESKHDGYLCTYQDEVQTALCISPWITYNDLHPAQIVAVNSKAAFDALLVKLYLFATGLFKPGQKSVKSVEKHSYKTTDKFILEKYDPDFKGKYDEGSPLPWDD